MLVSCRVPRHHGIDALTGLMQTHIFYVNCPSLIEVGLPESSTTAQMCLTWSHTGLYFRSSYGMLLLGY